MNTQTCFDCFHLFGPDEDRFAVLKQMRDLPVATYGDDRALRELESLTYDQVFVCRDCAGWYGDHPIQVSANRGGAVRS